MSILSGIYSHWVALAAAIFLSAVAHLFIRLGSKAATNAQIVEWARSKVMIGYLLFIVSVLLMIYSMQTITLRTATALNSISYILVPFMAYKFVKDPIDLRIIIGSVIIIIGIVVFIL